MHAGGAVCWEGRGRVSACVHRAGGLGGAGVAGLVVCDLEDVWGKEVILHGRSRSADAGGDLVV